LLGPGDLFGADSASEWFQPDAFRKSAVRFVYRVVDPCLVYQPATGSEDTAGGRPGADIVGDHLTGRGEGVEDHEVPVAGERRHALDAGEVHVDVGGQSEVLHGSRHDGRVGLQRSLVDGPGGAREVGERAATEPHVEDPVEALRQGEADPGYRGVGEDRSQGVGQVERALVLDAEAQSPDGPVRERIRPATAMASNRVQASVESCSPAA
jgi:hypothetical protein